MSELLIQLRNGISTLLCSKSRLITDLTVVKTKSKFQFDNICICVLSLPIFIMLHAIYLCQLDSLSCHHMCSMFSTTFTDKSLAEK